MDAFQEKFDLVFDTEAAYGVVPVSLAASCIASFVSTFKGMNKLDLIFFFQ